MTPLPAAEWPAEATHAHAAPALDGWLDLFRWLAAASVLVTHLCIRMLAPYARLPAAARTLPMRGYFFLSGFDHYAVMVFFVLSGFLVGTPVWRSIARSGTYDRRRFAGYLARRLTRLCTVLWPALALSGLAVLLARQTAPLDVQPWAQGLDEALGGATLLCNAVFLQTTACVQYAQNGALWSLYNEFWYYLTWPLLAVGLFARAAPIHHRLACTTIFVVAFAALTHFQFTGSAWGPYMAIWLMGVAAGARGRALIRSTRLAAIMLASVLLLIRVAVRHDYAANPFIAYPLDIVVSGLFANLLLTLRHDRALAPPSSATLHARLAGMSFSLYVIHVPALMLYISLLLKYNGTGWQMQMSTPVVWAEIAGGLTIAVASGFALWLLAERHTPALRRMITHRLDVRQPVAIRLHE